VRIATIRDQAILGPHRKLPQRLAIAFPVAARQPEIVTAPVRHPQAEVHAPLATGLARFFDVGAINEPDSQPVLVKNSVLIELQRLVGT